MERYVAAFHFAGDRLVNLVARENVCDRKACTREKQICVADRGVIGTRDILDTSDIFFNTL